MTTSGHCIHQLLSSSKLLPVQLRSSQCILALPHCHYNCLSNAMHRQNINSPVHVCVCLSVTLSVNSPTGQTPQRIFTVDSLKDGDLRKDVPFGGLDDE